MHSACLVCPLQVLALDVEVACALEKLQLY